ncbi:hypothetical protein Tsubulata_015290, partial [Turnera subulata]
TKESFKIRKWNSCKKVISFSGYVYLLSGQKRKQKKNPKKLSSSSSSSSLLRHIHPFEDLCNRPTNLLASILGLLVGGGLVIMDGENSLHLKNWGYYELETNPAPHKSHLNLQLMPEKPFAGVARSAAAMAANGGYLNRDIPAYSQSMYSMDYMREAWISSHQREKYLNVIPPGTPSYGLFQETPSVHHMQMYQQPESVKDERVEQEEEEEVPVVEKVNGSSKKRQGPKAPKSPKAKKGKRGPRLPKAEGTPSIQRVRSVKKPTELIINGISMDISGIPIPVCSCTGTPQQCYRWGCGGWQSACCTTGMSVYPLPMSTKRRGARIAGRKMSIGAFKKVLEKLAAEGYDFSNPIDLRTHWAKHGTNKFVTIR